MKEMKMSRDIFVLTDEDLENFPRRTQYLNRDLVKGLRNAVNNSQVILALEHLTYIVEILDRELETQYRPEVVVTADAEVTTPTAKKEKKAVEAPKAQEEEVIVDND